MRILGIQPRDTPEHERNIVQKDVHSRMHFPASFIRLWPSCHFDMGDRDMAGGCSYNKLIPYKTASFACKLEIRISAGKMA